MSCLTQKPTCRSFGQQQSELCEYSPNLFHQCEEQNLIVHTCDTRARIQDPLVLLDPACLTETLLDWLPVLERVLGPVEAAAAAAAAGDSHADGPGDGEWDGEGLPWCSEPAEPLLAFKETAEHMAEDEETGNSDDLRGKEDQKLAVASWSPPEPVRLEPPKAVEVDLLSDLTQLATLYTELSCFRKLQTQQGLGCTAFLRRYFFLLDHERVRRMCLLAHQEQPELQVSFMEAMLGQRCFCFGQDLQVKTRPSQHRLSAQVRPSPVRWRRTSIEEACSGPCAV